MFIKISILVLALMNGGWMVFDGLHVRITGKYFGPPEPGPWSGLVSVLGVDPFTMGPVFIVIGTCWIGSVIGLLYSVSWAWWVLLFTAIATLWYIPMGSIISIAVIALLIIFRSELGYAYQDV